MFGTTSRAAPFASLIGTQGGTNFDPNNFTWIGSANNEVSTCISWHTASVKTFDQLRDTELIIGGDGPSADGEQFARVMNALFETKIKIVSGYPAIDNRQWLRSVALFNRLPELLRDIKLKLK